MLHRRLSESLDSNVVAWLERGRRLALVISAAVGAVVLLAWAWPLIARALPASWQLMRPTTALSILLLAAGAYFADRAPRVALAAVVAAACVAASALLGYALGLTPRLDVFLGSAAGHASVGRMSVQTAITVASLATSMAISGESRRARLVSLAAGAIGFLVILVVVSGHLFRVAHFVGHADETLMSPHTTLALGLLLVNQLGRLLRSEPLSVIASIGLGGHMARRVMPLVLTVPLVLISVGAHAVTSGWVSIRTGAAGTAVVLTLLLVGVVLVSAHRLNRLDRELRRMSLSDHLTGLLNRRGFDFLGTYVFADARRRAHPMFVAYFDLDGLKTVNDTLGHAAGSELLNGFAEQLTSSARATDLVARLGGDEFAVLGSGSSVEPLLTRLAAAVELANQERSELAQISYSAGFQVVVPRDGDTLERVVARADAEMYLAKKRKSGERAVVSPTMWRGARSAPARA